MSMMHHLLLTTALAAPVAQPAGPPLNAFLAHAELSVTPGAAPTVRAELVLEVLDGGPLAVAISDSRIAIDELTVDGQPAGVISQGQRLVLVGAWPAGSHRVRYRGRAKAKGTAESGRLQIFLPAAARSRVWVDDSADLAIEVDGAIAARGAHFQAGSASTGPITVSWGPQGVVPVRERRVRVDQQTALSVDEAEVRAVTFLDVHVEHGELAELPLRVPGGAEAVEVLEPAGAVVQQAGDRLTVRLSDPITDFARVALRYRAAAPDADGAPVPIATRADFRGKNTVAILRTDHAVVIPTSGTGTGITFADLPDRLRHSLPGTPVAAFSGIDPAGRSFDWRRLETTPAPEPANNVDHARYEASFSESGSGAMRATWQVRNDRAPFLRVRLPDDWQPVSVRVAGRTVTVSRQGDMLLIPLEKSTETLAGRVQLPVELSAVGPGQPWARRGWHTVEGPALQAPVSHVEWQVHLPPGRTAQQTQGARLPASTRQTIDMGGAHRLAGAEGTVLAGVRGVAGVRARAGTRRAKDKTDSDTAEHLLQETALKRTSTAYWSAAYEAYKGNDFDQAEALLASSLELDPDNVAAQQLQSNMVIVNSSAGSASGANEAVARRVKAMARARTNRTVERQAQLTEEATRAERSGDLHAARDAYQQLAETTAQLAILEEEESVDQKHRLAEIEEKLEALEPAAHGHIGSGSVGGWGGGSSGGSGGSLSGFGSDSSGGAGFAVGISENTVSINSSDSSEAPSESRVSHDSRTEIDFDDIDVETELIKPRGALLLDRIVLQDHDQQTDFDDAPRMGVADTPPSTGVSGLPSLPQGVSAATGDIALPIAIGRLLHVEQQLLPTGTTASFDIRVRTRER